MGNPMWTRDSARKICASKSRPNFYNTHWPHAMLNECWCSPWLTSDELRSHSSTPYGEGLSDP